MQIEVVTAITPEHVEAFARLMPQHSPGVLPPTPDHLQREVDSPANTVLVALDEQTAIVGTLTIFMTPGGTIGWIEDVAVDAAARGQGIGEALVLTLDEQVLLDVLTDGPRRNALSLGLMGGATQGPIGAWLTLRALQRTS